MAWGMFLKQSKGSIVNKLTTFYASAAILILCIIAVLLIISLDKIILTAEKQYLIDEAHIIQSTLQENPHNYNALKQEVNGVPLALKNSSYYYYMQIVNVDTNKAIMQTPAFNLSLKGALFPKLHLNNWNSKFIFWKSATMRPFILMTAPVEFDSKGKVTTLMQMALDMSYPEKMTHQYHSYVLGFFIIFVIIFIVVGRMIANRCLRHLYQMARITEDITATKLSRRIDHHEWPKELTSLGKAFNTMISGIDNAFSRLSQCTNELAHELRIPFNNIISGTEVMLSRERTLPEYQHVLASNLEELHRLSKVIDTILFLARAEVPQAPITKSQLDVAKEIAKICEYYKTLSAEKNILIHYSGEGWITVEPILFQRALSNVVDNAIKYSQPNSTVTVKSERVDHGIKILVLDNGVGIPAEHLPHVFERFYRVATGEIHAHQGWGLGLAIVKSIMDLHKGSINLVSKEHEGTQLELIFPYL